MRSRTVFASIVGLSILTSACVPSQRCGAAERLAQERWDRLSRSMRGSEESMSEVVAASSSLSADQRATLGIVARSAARSVVHIQTSLVRGSTCDELFDGPRQTATTSGGSGVVIADEGLILTNEHVLRNAVEIVVLLSDGSRYPVRRFASDVRCDLAVLRIDPCGLPALQPADTSPGTLTPIVAVGRPTPAGGDQPRTGVVTHASASLQERLDPRRDRDYGALIESTAAIEPGFSGGPLLDAEGRLIGLSVAVSCCGSRDRTRAYAIPFNAATRRTVARLCQGTRVAIAE